MDGTLAAIFFIIGLTDMGLNDCPTGCLAPGPAPARVGLQISGVEFQERWTGSAAGVSYDLPRRYGPFQPMLSLTATEDRDLWLGIGAKWTSQHLWDSPVFVESSFQPGLHLRGDGPDLGGELHFRSSLGVGYAFDNGATLTMSYDHRSNGDRLSRNPGLETLSLRYAWSFD